MAVDETGALLVSIPVAWDDRESGSWTPSEADGEAVGRYFVASPDVEGFFDEATSGTPGLWFAASRLFDITPLERLESRTQPTCIFGEREDYDDGVYRGLVDVYHSCGTAESVFFEIAARAIEDPELLVVVQIVAVTEADLDVADEIQRTFEVVGPLRDF